MAIDYAAYRELFPITKEWAYLEHAATSPLSTPVVQAMQRVIALGYEQGWQGEDELVKEMEEIRARAAQLIGATPAEVCFTNNTSEGLNIVANGLDWRAGDNIVGAETEFPANVYPWKNLARYGVELRLAPARDNRILVEDIAALMDKRTRLVALSYVEFGTGFRNDLTAIGKLCRERGALLCVDSIQGLGALPLDVRQSHIDFLANGGHKWLMGIEGTGIFYCRRDLITQLKPTPIGWRSVENCDDYYSYDNPLKEDASRWETGCSNWLGRNGLGAAMKMLLEVGIANIEQRIMALTDYLIARLQERGYRITSPIASWAERSGILCFNHPDYPADGLAKRLADAKVAISLRRDVIRVAPHFYNNEEDLDRLLGAIP